MSYVLAFIGFVALIVLHEAGHFAAAKAVGMRVERFSLFFPPTLVKHRRGETEYGIGALPFGGYVKISGMSPNEQFDSPEIAARAYCNQPVWKRVVVIAAGPAVNLVLAFIFAWIFFLGGSHQLTRANGTPRATNTVNAVIKGTPAYGKLEPGDRIVSIDGVHGNWTTLHRQILEHTCAGGAQTQGCAATTPATFVVSRDGQLLTLHLRPRWSRADQEMLIGFGFTPILGPNGPLFSASASVTGLWGVTKATISDLAQIFKPKQRGQLHSIIAAYAYTQQDFATGFSDGLQILALVSLALAIMNLLPLLPLDGGHIFWALAEKLRGRRIPPVVVERASFAGIALLVLLVFIVMGNDISALANGHLTVH